MDWFRIALDICHNAERLDVVFDVPPDPKPAPLSDADIEALIASGQLALPPSRTRTF